MTSSAAKQMNTFENAMNTANALNSEPLKQLIRLAEGARKKLGLSPDAWADLSEKLVEVIQADEKDAKVWCEGATEGINEVLAEYKAKEALQKDVKRVEMKVYSGAECDAYIERVCMSGAKKIVKPNPTYTHFGRHNKNNIDGSGHNWLSAPMLHPLNPEKMGGIKVNIDGTTGVHYGTAKIERHTLAECEDMLMNTLRLSGLSLERMLCFQINNNEDCFVLTNEDVPAVVRDAQAKMPIRKSSVFSCEKENKKFLGKTLYGVAFTDPSIEKRGRTIYPPCLFSDMISGQNQEGECPYMDTNTYWFFDKEKMVYFSSLAIGIELVSCDECGEQYDKIDGKKRIIAHRPFLICPKCIFKAEYSAKAEKEVAKSVAENKARMAEPARATAEAELLEMLEDKETIVKVKPVKAESAKERNKRLAAEAAKELKAEKKRKEEHLKACGLYKSPEQLKKEREARLKAEISMMGKRK